MPVLLVALHGLYRPLPISVSTIKKNIIFHRIFNKFFVLHLARIYTVYVQSHDWMLLSNFMISTLLSSSVFVAACVYKKKSKKE